MNKLKLSLFLFTLGLGASSAYANDPVYACYKQCAENYRQCVGFGTGLPCQQWREECDSGCPDMV
ncbi:hypothetical protein ACFOLJ_07405 [Rugamonas sp. CCM 8940]|uniref:hypothetical protein n=1 Tax=Rugamonas sp. CCM 8940 TaxID=2765359 RepID=UPI0018F4BA99|nr:hypothetical protein [Rugamonas sp. CCM 8940]MBJ7310222.1 hypothetical protein [Rugamonas sp. CCM 8940]